MYMNVCVACIVLVQMKVNNMGPVSSAIHESPGLCTCASATMPGSMLGGGEFQGESFVAPSGVLLMNMTMF